MNRIAEVNANGTSDIKVSGHTDDVPLIFGSNYRDNWDLAAHVRQVWCRHLPQMVPFLKIDLKLSAMVSLDLLSQMNRQKVAPKTAVLKSKSITRPPFP